MSLEDFGLTLPDPPRKMDAPILAQTALGRAVSEYTGRVLRELSVAADPHLRNVTAVRAVTRAHHAVTRATDRTIFFLVRTSLEHVSVNDLEECEFASWPPEAK